MASNVVSVSGRMGWLMKDGLGKGKPESLLSMAEGSTAEQRAKHQTAVGQVEALVVMELEMGALLCLQEPGATRLFKEEGRASGGAATAFFESSLAQATRNAPKGSNELEELKRRECVRREQQALRSGAA